MPSPESQPSLAPERVRSKSEKRDARFSRHIDRIVGNAPELPKRKKEIMNARTSRMSSEQRAVKIYELLLAERVAGGDLEKGLDESGRARLKLLWEDKAVREIFFDKVLESKADIREYEVASLYREAKELIKTLASENDEATSLERSLNLGTGGHKESKAEDLADLKMAIETDEKALVALKTLENRPHTPENTDVVAMLHYDQLGEYKRQNDENHFVWFDSRRDLLVEIKAYQKQGKMAHLMGPAGTGKTTLFKAVIRDLTGGPTIVIPCAPNLSEEGLMYRQDLRGGEGAKEFQGLIAEALTGFLNSQDATPSDKARLGVLLDEVDRLNHDKVKAVLKLIQGFKPGDDLYGKLVRQGWVIGAASNLPIEEEALRREFAKMPVDYLKMTWENPELYKFMFINLMHEQGHMPAISRSLLSPAYDEGILENPENLPDCTVVKAKPKILPIDKVREVKDADGNTIATEQTINKAHGFFYRLAFAIRAIEDAYMHGSKFNEKHMANTALYEKTDHVDGRDITKVSGYIPALDGKEPDKAYSGVGTHLKLNVESTITAMLIEGWIKSWDGQSDIVAHIQGELERHINQTTSEDKPRLHALFQFFGILGEGNMGAESQHARKDDTVSTPKEMAYLLSDVPQPWTVEKPAGVKAPEAGTPKSGAKAEAVKHENYNVVLEDGTTVNIEKRGLILPNGTFNLETETLTPFEIAIGTRFMANGESFAFVGMVDDESSPHHGQPVGQLSGEEGLKKVFTLEELNWGIEEEFRSLIGETGIDDMKDDLLNCWEIEGCKEKHDEFVF